MSEPMEGTNPAILKWAREKSQYSLEDACKGITANIDNLISWEQGESFPSYRQLEGLANRYGRPIALFFFPEPPIETTPEQQFRTLPNIEIQKLPPRIVKLVRDGYAKQLSLVELTNGVNSSPRRIFDEVSVTQRSNPQLIANNVREYLGVSIEEQNQWKDPNEALKAWRRLIQSVGIFVFKAAFSESGRGYDGFCLFDKEFPIIYLNNSAYTHRKIFTLFHELAHLLLGNSSVTQENTTYIKTLSGRSHKIELFCNQFAAEFLMPLEDISEQHSRLRNTPLSITLRVLSARYKTSREAILFRLLNLNLVSKHEFDSIHAKLYDDNPDGKKQAMVAINTEQR